MWKMLLKQSWFRRIVRKVANDMGEGEVKTRKRVAQFESELLSAMGQDLDDIDVQSAKKEVIIVSGFGQSGNSAVRDFLKEFDNVFVPDTEDFLIKYAGGLAAIKTTFLHNNNLYTGDFAIKNYLRNVMVFQNRYESLYKGQFLKETAKFINCLIRGYYVVARPPFNWPFYYANDGMPFANIVFVPRVFSEEEIDTAIRRYTSALLGHATDKAYICLINSIQNGQILEGIRLFDRARVITCARDVRDVYVDFKVKCQHSTFLPIDNAEALSWYFDSLYLGYPVCDARVLNIKFEKLVQNYEKTTTEIMSFLGLSAQEHTHAKEHFNPLESLSNIGLWRAYSDDNVVRYLTTHYKLSDLDMDANVDKIS